MRQLLNQIRFAGDTTIDTLLNRSEELEEAIAVLFEATAYEESPRIDASRIMCSVALEHGRSLRVLVRGNNCTSAFSLARLQYEAFVRAMWIFYAASESSVLRLLEVPTNENEKRLSRIPMLGKMLEELEGKAPAEAIRMINEFKHYSWRSLSSFVHGGNHAVTRHTLGYPVSLVDQVIRMSNGLSTMVGMLMAIQTGIPELVQLIGREIQPRFSDCLPELIR